MSGDREGESPGLVEVQMADLEHCFFGSSVAGNRRALSETQD